MTKFLKTKEAALMFQYTADGENLTLGYFTTYFRITTRIQKLATYLKHNS